MLGIIPSILNLHLIGINEKMRQASVQRNGKKPATASNQATKQPTSLLLL